DPVDVDFELGGEVLADEGEDFPVIHLLTSYHAPSAAAAKAPRPTPLSANSAAVRPTASTSAQRAASRSALAIPSGPALPWPTAAIPRGRSRIAPPVARGSNSRRGPPSAGFKSSPPSAATGFERAAPATAPPIARADPSISFSATLPVNPSVT